MTSSSETITTSMSNPNLETTTLAKIFKMEKNSKIKKKYTFFNIPAYNSKDNKDYIGNLDIKKEFLLSNYEKLSESEKDFLKNVINLVAARNILKLLCCILSIMIISMLIVIVFVSLEKDLENYKIIQSLISRIFLMIFILLLIFCIIWLSIRPSKKDRDWDISQIKIDNVTIRRQISQNIDIKSFKLIKPNKEKEDIYECIEIIKYKLNLPPNTSTSPIVTTSI